MATYTAQVYYYDKNGDQVYCRVKIKDDILRVTIDGIVLDNKGNRINVKFDDV